MNANSGIQPLKCSVAEARRQLTEPQRILLDQIWNHFCTTGEWPLSRVLFSQHEKALVREALLPLGGNVVREERNQQGRGTLRLSLYGALLGSEGEILHKLLARYFEFQREQFKTNPTKQQIGSEEIRAALNLSEQQTALLGRLIWLGSLYGGSGGQDKGTWTVGAMDEVVDFPAGDLSLQVEQSAARFFRADAHVFDEDRLQHQLNNAKSAPWQTWPICEQKQMPHHEATEGDPLKRRYQVFVSSTFNDLIEERKHVMQALLVTKCIPSGMELFPAASTAQWNLIKSVIDDCDYYIVIVAGKYGSIGPRGLSYTEMEFDYAVSTGKPVIGFYHSDIRKLPFERLEETDDGRRKLAAFSAKVKQQLCQAWNTPEGLASAVKTAILHAIETDPKSGWVRASSVPSWTMVWSLQTRIAELEGRPNKEPGVDKFARGGQTIEIPARITWDESDDPKNRCGSLRLSSMKHTFTLTWDQVFLHLAPEPGLATSRLGLLRKFGYSLALRMKSEIERTAKGHVVRLDGAIDGVLFDKLIQTLLARKLFRRVNPPKRVRTKALYWELSPAGVQRLAELRAIPNNEPS